MNCRGHALVCTLLVFSLIFTVLFASLALKEGQTSIAVFQRDKVQAYYKADGEIEIIMALLYQDSEWPLEMNYYDSVVQNHDDVTVTVEKRVESEGDCLYIESTAVHKSAQQTLEAMIKLGEYPEVVFWKEKHQILPD